MAELEAEKARRVAEAGAAARALSRKRRDAAEKLADAIGRELSQLGMGRARVVVEVHARRRRRATRCSSTARA